MIAVTHNGTFVVFGTDNEMCYCLWPIITTLSLQADQCGGDLERYRKFEGETHLHYFLAKTKLAGKCTKLNLDRGS